MSDDFDDLNALLTESIEIVKETKLAAESRKRMKQVHGVTSAERQEDSARVLAWEAQHVWRPEANVARFVEQQCQNCGDCQYLFSGLLQRQSHRHLKDGSKRWVAVESSIASLPNEIQLATMTVPFCLECCDKVGFDLRNAYWAEGDKVEWQGDEAADEVESEAETAADPQAIIPDQPESTNYAH